MLRQNTLYCLAKYRKKREATVADLQNGEHHSLPIPITITSILVFSEVDAKNILIELIFLKRKIS